MPRLFVAVDLAPEPRAALAALIAATAHAHPVPSARWTPTAHLHVTLRFLGSVPEAEIAALQAALAAVSAPRFSVALAGVGVFPAADAGKSPRVLWAGLAPREPLHALKLAVDERLGPDPESRDRGFTPHVTLARVHDPAHLAARAFLDRHAQLASVPWLVEGFSLYVSEALATGPAYRVLAQYPLRAP
jgi:2'-5' RNA ligase